VTTKDQVPPSQRNASARGGSGFRAGRSPSASSRTRLDGLLAAMTKRDAFARPRQCCWLSRLDTSIRMHTPRRGSRRTTCSTTPSTSTPSRPRFEESGLASAFPVGPESSLQPEESRPTCACHFANSITESKDTFLVRMTDEGLRRPPDAKEPPLPSFTASRLNRAVTLDEPLARALLQAGLTPSLELGGSRGARVAAARAGVVRARRMYDRKPAPTLEKKRWESAGSSSSRSS
jgi:hypothetical protein